MSHQEFMRTLLTMLRFAILTAVLFTLCITPLLLLVLFL